MELVLIIVLVGIGLFLVLYQDHRAHQARTTVLLEQLPKYRSQSLELFKVYHLHELKRVWIELDERSKRLFVLIGMLMSFLVQDYLGWTWLALGVWVLASAGVVGLLLLNQLYFKKREREENIRKMLPNLLMHMCCEVALTSDLLVVLKATHQQAAEPVKTYVGRIIELLHMGYTTEKAIELVNSEVDLPAFNDLCIILLLYAKYGGNLEQALHNFRLYIQGHIKVTQALRKKTSGIITTSIILHIILFIVGVQCFGYIFLARFY